MFPQTAVISIGNELLTGRTVNTNLLFIGRELARAGLSISLAPVAGDKKQSIEESLSYCLQHYDLIITTGGLGPTSDDVTKQIVADYFGLPLVLDERIWQSIRERYPGRDIPAINQKQAEMPEGFSILPNLVGSAPGLYYRIPVCFSGKNHQSETAKTPAKLLILLPGVPLEMEHIFTGQVLPLLDKYYHLPSLTVKTIHTIAVPESQLAQIIGDLEIPESVDLAYLPQPGRVDLRIIGREHIITEEFTGMISQRIQEHIWGIDEETLASRIMELSKIKGFTLAAAESCTGGKVQAMLTSVPGASAFFSGGVVSYSNEAKINLLGVAREIIDAYGAVSIETAAAMARGVKRVFQADVGISVTGIAGPAGGTALKPVGTVCFAVATEETVVTFTKHFTGNRDLVREKSADYLLYLLIKSLTC